MSTQGTLYLQLGAVMRGSKVRKAVSAEADRLASRAQSLNTDKNDPIGREDGIRPGTHSPDGVARPYGRVTAPYAQEHGTAAEPRQRLLGRVVAELG